MKFVLIPLGSAGDMYPFVGLAEALQNRGHDVLILINEYFLGTVERARIPYRVISAAEDYVRAVHDPRIFHPIHGPRSVFSYGARMIQPVYDAVRAAGAPEDVTLVNSVLGWGARLAQDRDGYRLVTVDLQPAALFSAVDPPLLPGLSPRAPRWWNNFVFRSAEYVLLNSVGCRVVNEWRRRHGMSNVQRISDWWHSPDCILGMFPPWFASSPPDWPRQVRLTQLPLWDDGRLTSLPDEIQRFLDAGDPPIVFTPGSANPCDQSFWNTAVLASQQLGRRAMLMAQFSKEIPRRLPPEVGHFEYASFAQLLPRSAAIVHHGGIGTTARSLASAIPQIIRPFSHDQPDNARRVERLGVGAMVKPRQFTTERLARELDRLLGDRNVASRCRELSERITSVDPFAESCDVLCDEAQRRRDLSSSFAQAD